MLADLGWEQDPCMFAAKPYHLSPIFIILFGNNLTRPRPMPAQAAQNTSK